MTFLFLYFLLRPLLLLLFFWGVDVYFFPLSFLGGIVFCIVVYSITVLYTYREKCLFYFLLFTCIVLYCVVLYIFFSLVFLLYLYRHSFISLCTILYRVGVYYFPPVFFPFFLSFSCIVTFLHLYVPSKIELLFIFFLSRFFPFFPRIVTFYVHFFPPWKLFPRGIVVGRWVMLPSLSTWHIQYLLPLVGVLVLKDKGEG